MSMSQERQWTNEPELESYFVGLAGAGNGVVPTRTFGRGITLSYVSTGIVKLTFGDYPGRFVGGGILGKRATTPSQLASFDVVFGDPDATGTIFQASITNSSETLVDLQANQTITLELVFKRAGAGV